MLIDLINKKLSLNLQLQIFEPEVLSPVLDCSVLLTHEETYVLCFLCVLSGLAGLAGLAALAALTGLAICDREVRETSLPTETQVLCFLCARIKP